jgi:hypothetical protein
MSTVGAAFGPVAAELGAGEPQLVPQRHGQRFLLQDVDAPGLPIHAQGDEALDGARGRRLAEERPAGAEQVGGRGGHRTAGNDALDKIASSKRHTLTLLRRI